MKTYRLELTGDFACFNRLPAFGLEEKEIPFVIEIDGTGKLVNLVDTRAIVGKKKIAQRFLVPQGVKKTSGVAANLMWDNAEYVLGVDTKGKGERVIEQHAAFRARIDALPEDALNDAGIQAMQAFMDGIDLKQFESLPAWPDVLEANAPAHALFERIRPKLKDGVTVPRSFEDYEVAVNATNMPTGVTLTPMC